MMAECCAKSLDTSLQFSTQAVKGVGNLTDWVIKNRGGFAHLTGFLLVPSQFNDENSFDNFRHIDDLNTMGVEKVDLYSIDHKQSDLHGVICYPKGWNKEDKSRCVVYHDPNGAVVADLLPMGRPGPLARVLLELHQCPVAFYDYRGAGLNRELTSCSSLRFRPTYESIVEDGLAALKHFGSQYDELIVWGSSLGGGVGTCALDRYLAEFPEKKSKVSPYNHDSFTTTPRVVKPGAGVIFHGIASALGGNLNAEEPMKRLVNMGVKVTVLCHEDDPVIPKGARMVELFGVRIPRNVRLIRSPEYGHASLTPDMINSLFSPVDIVAPTRRSYSYTGQN